MSCKKNKQQSIRTYKNENEQQVKYVRVRVLLVHKKRKKPFM
jgi:hypothetical protein